MLEHLGFAVMPYHRPLGAFGEFWENFYTWWLMWALGIKSSQPAESQTMGVAASRLLDDKRRLPGTIFVNGRERLDKFWPFYDNYRYPRLAKALGT